MFTIYFIINKNKQELKILPGSHRSNLKTELGATWLDLAEV